MKKLLCLFAFSLVLSAPRAEAQMPVTDVASLTENVRHHLEIGLQWYQEYMQLKIQYEMLKQSYEALTNARSLGDVFDNPLLHSYLPDEWLEIYNDIKYAGYNARVGASMEIYRANQAFDACYYIKDEEERITCQALAIQSAAKKGLLVPALQMTARRSLQIKELMKAMGETKDMKEAAELQGRINAEQAFIENTQAEMMMYTEAAEVEKELQEQRAFEQIAETFATRGGITPRPTRF